jgi:FlaA1/EpsC-like NDP-sugar epimerase
MRITQEISDKEFFEFIVGRPESQLLSDGDLQLFFRKSRILIIGAGGSIGSALARRLSSAQIFDVYYLDRDESSLHGLALNLANISASQSDKFFIGDIRDRQSLRDVLVEVKPKIVIHAAALKHLVLLERFPREGYLTNIFGTLNVAELCLELGVEQFVNISTDKAANPISILGRTKKISELITTEVFSYSKIKHCSVRFGNVFASRGSVIETFVHQIKNKIPVTITDVDVCRYFMSQNEAANLVLASVSLSESGVYIQNMGQEVRIADIIHRIGKHFDLKPSIKVIGLQKGEKLHEELFDGPRIQTRFKEISRSTYHVTSGIIQEIKSNLPKTHEECIKLIETLMQK